ncbi:methenyltetrahydromethanopterin cyclohydrolase [Methylopila jiangsuensis]|uniref:Methenyltetrahydromethanopterin cyclohydrolase n=1 Tax=Methylopila jiangsuensis TaxID=586230 RepID=A0A9W6JI47_9HYPH|nr:methenyltetrahydromethanopterin cyclohydrolase [Methylopila jiangsuensis]MDR6286193.1 methenyltetrahydromethanopterin cyclohydrolase [Methylopila jiangsuensis]GLK75953.1 methenyltetrahydromethanopterin cyclohydrolase [Methylopila jiangsuensis]
MTETRPSVGTLVAPLVSSLIADAATLRLGVERTATGATIVDAGINVRGGLEAGRRITEICLGGLGYARFAPDTRFPRWNTAIHISTVDPVIACLGSQYAGWSLSEGDFFALGSGPARALWAKEELFGELGYKDKAESAALVLETDKRPPDALIAFIAKECGVAEDKLTLILTPTTSLAGSVQVVGRVLEVALHKAHALHFPLERIVDGTGVAPVAPPAADFLGGMGRTNDAVLYGGEITLYVEGPEDEAEQLANGLPSSTSRDHGRPFGEIFAGYNFDFYACDAGLFSPAVVTVTALSTGKSFSAGAFMPELVEKSFRG